LPWNRLDRSRHGRGKSGYVSPRRPRSEWKSHRGGCPRGSSKSADIDPQYSDYTDRQIADLAAYIRHLRQQRRYKELIAANDAGDANLGRRYFNGAGNCRSCHSPESDLAGIARKYDADGLSAHILRPGLSFIREGADAGSIAHLKALENYTLAEVQNLHAYLQTLK
jgi:cytochrome c553